MSEPTQAEMNARIGLVYEGAFAPDRQSGRQAILEIEAVLGLFWWRPMRDAVAELKWRGYRLDVFEGSGWGQRKFVVRGDPVALRMLNDWMERIGGKDEPA